MSDEPERARLLLRQCYDKALDTFWELASLPLSADGTAGACAMTLAGVASDGGCGGGNVVGCGGSGVSGSAAALVTGKDDRTERKR